jgi:VanZ family protein
VRAILLLSLLIGIATELAQFWIPGRTPRLWDIADDTAGVLLGVVFALLTSARARRD